MKMKSAITILFPALFMTIITMILFSNMFSFSEINIKEISIVSLILLFPLLFLIQGILSAVNNINILFTLGVSILNFIILMIVYLNDSAFIYILIYLAFGIVGYIITNIIVKVKSSKK